MSPRAADAKATRRAEQVTDPRPKLARLSEKILNREVGEYTRLFDDAVAALREPREGSLWALDRQAAGENQAAIDALGDGAMQAQRLAISAAGHAEVLRMLMRHDRLLLVPAWTNSRAVLEPILMTCWLTDPEHNGFTIKLARDKKVEGKFRDEIGSVAFEGQLASTNHNITEMAKQFVPDTPFLYGLLSGATHSKLWLLNGLGADADEAILAIMNLLLPISHAYTQALCTYLGIDPTPYLTRRTRRHIALSDNSPRRQATPS